MASFTGILIFGAQQAEDNLFSTDDTIGAEVVAALRGNLLKGTSAYGNAQATPKNYSAIIPELSFADDLIFDRIYFLPRDPIELGLITEQTTHDVEIWNSGFPARVLQNITITEVSGTLLNNPAPPITIPPETELNYVLTVFLLGPPFQNTEYAFIFDSGQVFLIEITGQRIEAFIYEIDWKNGPQISYIFETVITKNDRYSEQRRALHSKPKRELHADFWFEDYELDGFTNDLLRFTHSILGIPIYPEMLWPVTNPIQGQSIITFLEDFTYFFNLRKFTILILAKQLDTNLLEIKEISSINLGAKQITFTQPMASAFVTAKTVFYPLMVGFIKTSYKPKFITDHLAKTSLVFEEIRL